MRCRHFSRCTPPQQPRFFFFDDFFSSFFIDVDATASSRRFTPLRQRCFDFTTAAYDAMPPFAPRYYHHATPVSRRFLLAAAPTRSRRLLLAPRCARAASLLISFFLSLFARFHAMPPFSLYSAVAALPNAPHARKSRHRDEATLPFRRSFARPPRLCRGRPRRLILPLLI